MTKYRYPGLNAYTKQDAFIFKGRDDDSGKLLEQINLNKTLVLHAESGVGKSSLIQAGLLPLIEKTNDNFICVTIKLTEINDDGNSFTLIHSVKNAIYEASPEIKNDNLSI